MGQVERAVVLLAEDDPAQREVLDEVLTFEGFRVIGAESSDEAIAKLSEKPDVVLLDVMGVLTAEFASALERTEQRPAVILVSGHHTLDAIAESVQADAFLAKPYGLESLLTTLGRVLEARRARKAPAFAPACVG